jgi:hypothetical protein
MVQRLLCAVLAVVMTAAAQNQSLSLEKLTGFLESSARMMQQEKMTDKEIASFLSKVKLTEKIDDSEVERLGSLGLGPRTMEALRKVAQESAALPGKARAATQAAQPKPIPPPSSEEQGAILDEVRRASLAYSRELPDFICTQVTRRYAAPVPGTRYGGSAQSDPSFQKQDELTIRLSYFDQKEDYKLILVNNRMATEDYQSLGGATSTGEFGSLLRGIFERKSQAHFEWDHWGTMRGRRVLVFSYSVPQANSEWHVVYEKSMEIVPGYSGVVMVDRATHRVLRITMKADGIPATFPVRSTETVLDYDFVDISNHKFLLPLRARMQMASRDMITRNEQEFHLYRKYSAESELRFDLPPAPLTEEQTKETPDPASPAKKK